MNKEVHVTINAPAQPWTYHGVPPEVADQFARRLCKIAYETGEWRHLASHLKELNGRIEAHEADLADGDI